MTIVWVCRLGEEPAGARSTAGKAGRSEAGRTRRAGLRRVSCWQAVGTDGRPGSFWHATWHWPPPGAGTGVDSFCFLWPLALQGRPNQAALKLLHSGFCRCLQQARLYIHLSFQASLFKEGSTGQCLGILRSRADGSRHRKLSRA